MGLGYRNNEKTPHPALLLEWIDGRRVGDAACGVPTGSAGMVYHCLIQRSDNSFRVGSAALAHMLTIPAAVKHHVAQHQFTRKIITAHAGVLNAENFSP